MKLTDRQREVLDYIVTFKMLNGYSPSIREIAQGCNTTSLTEIKYIMELLKERGYITFKEKISRSIVVLKVV